MDANEVVRKFNEWDGKPLLIESTLVQGLRAEIDKLYLANRQSMAQADARSIENVGLRAALERTLPALAAAAAGASTQIAAGEVYRQTRAALALAEPAPVRKEG